MSNVELDAGPDQATASTSLDTPEHPAPRLPSPPDTEWAYRCRDSVADALDAIEATLDDKPLKRVARRRALTLRECGRAGVLIECRDCGTPHLVPYRCSAR